MLCTFVAILKQPAAMKAAKFGEKAFLLSVLSEMTNLDGPPGTDELERLFERFIQAVFARCYVTHQVCVGVPAVEAALEFVL